jgi:hypothetical protein
MKVEFNGRVVAGFLLGAVCGALVLFISAAGTVARIQGERDEARATIAVLNARILQFTIAAQQKSSAPAAASPLGLLDILHPGLGTLAIAADKAIKADQAKRAASAQQPAVPQGPVVVTEFSDSCGPNGFLINGECSSCNAGLHPGKFADGTVGCVP